MFPNGTLPLPLPLAAPLATDAAARSVHTLKLLLKHSTAHSLGEFLCSLQVKVDPILSIYVTECPELFLNGMWISGVNPHTCMCTAFIDSVVKKNIILPVDISLQNF